MHLVYQNYRKLRQLYVSNNAIRNLDYVALLSKIPSLVCLDLSANPVTDINNYRQNVFEKVPTLTALDGFNAEGSECSFEGGEGFTYDDDDFQDNDFMGQYYDPATQQLRKGLNAGEADDHDYNEDEGDSDSAQSDQQADESSDSQQKESDAKRAAKSSAEDKQRVSSISDGDPCKR